MKNDSRYPYTYACDLIRSFAGYNEMGTILSRSDASQIITGIASALGMDDAKLARNLADYYLTNQKELTEKSVKEFLGFR